MIKYPHFAFDNLYLTNGYSETHIGDEVVYEYEREDEIEQCIRRLVLRKPEPLRGWDLRFLRRGLELSQADFGEMVDRDAQTVARWEKAAEIIPKFVDLTIRIRFAERFEPGIKLADVLDFIDGTAATKPKLIKLSLSASGWDITPEPEKFYVPADHVERHESVKWSDFSTNKKSILDLGKIITIHGSSVVIVNTAAATTEDERKYFRNSSLFGNEFKHVVAASSSIPTFPDFQSDEQVHGNYLQ